MTRTVGSELFRACETFSFWEWNEAANTVRETENPRRDKSAWLLPSSSSSEEEEGEEAETFTTLTRFCCCLFFCAAGFATNAFEKEVWSVTNDIFCSEVL